MYPNIKNDTVTKITSYVTRSLNQKVGSVSAPRAYAVASTAAISIGIVMGSRRMGRITSRILVWTAIAEKSVPTDEIDPGVDAEARLDLHLWSHGEELYEAWVDVTATHPWMQQSRHAAAERAGAAVASA